MDSILNLPLETNLLEHFDQDELESEVVIAEQTKTEQPTTRFRSYLRIRPIGVNTNCPESTFHIIDAQRLVATAPHNSQIFKNSKARKDGYKKAFTFDQIYSEKADQKTVYESAVKPLVTNFFNGENALLFAYGMTSSGKSFTMRGNHKEPGVIPRCIQEVFSKIYGKILDQPLIKRHKFNEYTILEEKDIDQELAVRTFILNQVEKIDKSSNYSAFYSNNSTVDMLNATDQTDPGDNKKYIVWVSFLELYNDMLFDLCAVDIANERTMPLKLMRDANDNYFVSGLRHVFVRSAEDAHKVMLFGLEHLKKHVQSTGMNKHSSRSHAVFTITLIDMHELEAGYSYKVNHVRSLSLADLAGRERADKTGNMGLRMQEANRINVSLLVLNHCLRVMRKNQKLNGPKQIVPYGNSNLTKVFKPYFCGLGLTAMFINMNPLPEHFDETFATLEFSATASEIVITKMDSKKQVIGDSIRKMTQIWLDSNKKKRKLDRTNGDKLEETDLDLSYVLVNQVRESILKNVSVLSDEMEEVEYYKALIQQLQTQLEELQNEKADSDLKKQVEVTKKMFELDSKLRKEFDERNERDIARVEYVMNKKIAMIEDEYRLIASEHFDRQNELQQQLFDSLETIHQLQHDLKAQNDQHEITRLVNELVYEASSFVYQENEQNLKSIIDSFKKPEQVDKNTSVSHLTNGFNVSFGMQTENGQYVDCGINTSLQATASIGTDPMERMKVDQNTSACFDNNDISKSFISSPTSEVNEMKKEIKVLQAMLELKDKNYSALEQKCQALNAELLANKNNNVAEQTMNNTMNMTRNIEAPMTARKKKRELNDSNNDICQQYLNLIKDISPKTNRKKKRVESESVAVAEIKTESKLENKTEERLDENEVDDLAFLIEEEPKGASKSRKKSTIGKVGQTGRGKRSRKPSIIAENQVVQSARKKIPNNHRDSFVIESEEAIIPNPIELNRTGKKLRSGRRIKIS